MVSRTQCLLLSPAYTSQASINPTHKLMNAQVRIQVFHRISMINSILYSPQFEYPDDPLR